MRMTEEEASQLVAESMTAMTALTTGDPEGRYSNPRRTMQPKRLLQVVVVVVPNESTNKISSMTTTLRTTTPRTMTPSTSEASLARGPRRRGNSDRRGNVGGRWV